MIEIDAVKYKESFQLMEEECKEMFQEFYPSQRSH